MLMVAALVLAACAQGPSSETAAKIQTKGSSLPTLTAEGSTEAQSVARSVLLLAPSVREGAGLTQASADQIAIERAVLFPSLGIGITGGTGSASRGDASAQLSGEQLIFDFGSTKRAVSAADLNLQIQYLELQKTIDAVVLDGIVTHREIAMYGALLKVRRDQATVMGDLYKLISERRDIGAAAAPDLLETRNRIERAEYDLLNTELESDELKDKLQRIAGSAKGGALPRFAGQCSAPAGGSDDAKIAQIELAKAALNLESAQKSHLPRISLNPLALTPLGGGNVSTGVDLNVDSSLFDGGAKRSRENAARNRQQSATAALEAARRNEALDDAKFRRQTSSLQRKISMLERQIGVAGQTRDLYRSQYFELGTREVIDVLDAEETVFDRRVELIEAEFQLDALRAECAARSKTLRDTLNLSAYQIYGYPLTADGF